MVIHLLKKINEICVNLHKCFHTFINFFYLETVMVIMVQIYMNAINCVKNFKYNELRHMLNPGN